MNKSLMRLKKYAKKIIMDREREANELLKKTSDDRDKFQKKANQNGQKSIIKEMEAPVNVDSNENKEVLNVNSLKILIVKEICDKLRYMRNYSDDEIEQIEGKEKLAQALKYGMVEKKDKNLEKNKLKKWKKWVCLHKK